MDGWLAKSLFTEQQKKPGCYTGTLIAGKNFVQLSLTYLEHAETRITVSARA